MLLAGAGSDPHASAYGRWAAEDAAALWALLHDPVRQLHLRRALADVDPGLSSSLLFLTLQEKEACVTCVTCVTSR